MARTFTDTGAPLTTADVAQMAKVATKGARRKAKKTKRLHRDPRVAAAPCTLRGKVKGEPVSAEARLLEGEQARTAARALARRHRVLQGVLQGRWVL